MAKDKHTFSILMLNDWIDRLKEIGAKQDRSVNYLIVKAVEQVYGLSGDSA
jgi:predicted transcriptional regulator